MKPRTLKNIIRSYSFIDGDGPDLFKFGIIDGSRMSIVTLRKLREGKGITEKMMESRYRIVNQSRFLVFLKPETEEGEE